MGQTTSVPTDTRDRIDKLTSSCFTEIEKFTFKNQFKAENDDQLYNQLGIKGSGLMAQSAQFLAAYPHSMNQRAPVWENVLKVVAFYDGRLAQALKLDDHQFTKLLFLSLAVKSEEIEDEPLNVDESKFYLQFTDFLDFVALLCSVYQESSNHKFEIKVKEQDVDAAQRMLEPFKAAIIDFNSFQEFVKRFPYLLGSLAIIWDQLLFEQTERETATTSSSPSSLKLLSNSETAIQPQEICMLYMARGPQILNSIKLYQARNDGFSMRAFESKVVNWKAPTLLFIKGKRQTKPNAEQDAAVPKVTDSTPRTSPRVAYAVIVDNAWKVSNKKGFAGYKTVIYQLEPQFSVFTVAPAAQDNGIGYFSPDLGGIGIGIVPPQSKRFIFQRNGNIALVIDRFLEFGVFRCIGNGGTFLLDAHLSTPVPYEDRFKISTVETWGIGDEKVLAKQQREWEWEKREVTRRQNVNVGEDRSILELAGIVGQYDPNRGTN